MSIDVRTAVVVSATLKLDESQIEALECLTSYHGGVDKFFEVFYKEMGRHYLEPHEAGLRKLFDNVSENARPALEAAKMARKDLAEYKTYLRSEKLRKEKESLESE
jgi:hypothetical protein